MFLVTKYYKETGKLIIYNKLVNNVYISSYTYTGFFLIYLLIVIYP